MVGCKKFEVVAKMYSFPFNPDRNRILVEMDVPTTESVLTINH